MAIVPSMGPSGASSGHAAGETGAGDTTTRRVMRYALLPGIVPRLKHLGQGFGSFAYLLALILRSVRLLPQGHPMLNAVNIGRFGMVDVIAAAANNLVVSRKNIDQLMIFGAVVIAVIMIVLQFIIIGFYAVLAPDTANAAAPTGMFTTPDPNNDVVLTFLQQTIGLDKFFNNASPVGFSIAAGIRAMLGFYSTGLMIIATVIVLYYVITVVGESAQSGQPFGRRFNGLWAPVRLVLALGLLVPLGNGLNASQYIALSIARAGTGFATQAWNKFVPSIKDPKNIMAPVVPLGFTEVGKHIFMMEVCKAAWDIQNPSQAIVVKSQFPQAGTIGGDIIAADPFGGTIITSPVENTMAYTYSWVATDSAGKEVFKCGSISQSVLATQYDAGGISVAKVAMNAYAKAIGTAAIAMRPHAQKFASAYIASDGATPVPTSSLPTPDVVYSLIKAADESVFSAITSGSSGYQKAVVDEVFGKGGTKGGWGNAATFYMKIAFANQKILEIVKGAVPKPVRIGSAEEVAAQKSWWGWLWDEDAAKNTQLDYIRTAIEQADLQINQKIEDTQNSLANTGGLGARSTFSNVMKDDGVFKVISAIFSIDEFQKLVDPDQQNIFPMARLVTIGGDILNRAFVAFGAGVAVGFFNGALANMVFFIGFVGIGVGFVLFYILPFMPFMYFFFAIVEWGMGVLEAMVGAPLWALAHLRIDGEGMPGQAAMKGYEILFGILLRPFFILFGLLASYVCFNSGAYLLNLIFAESVNIRTGGVTSVSYLGFVGYLVMYAVIIYHLGLVCFKMIDQIPNQVLRWIGMGNVTYQDGKADPIGNVSQIAVGAGALLGPQLGGQLAGAAGSLGRGGKAGINKLRGKGKPGAGVS